MVKYAKICFFSNNLKMFLQVTIWNTCYISYNVTIIVYMFTLNLINL